MSNAQVLDVVAALKNGPRTKQYLEHVIGMNRHSVGRLIELMTKRGEVEFAGFGERIARAGTAPALWRWKP